MSEPCSVDSERNVAIAFQRVAIRVELEIHPPELVSGIEAKPTKNGEKGNTRAKTHLRESVAGREWPKDIGGNQIEDSTPAIVSIPKTTMKGIPTR